MAWQPWWTFTQEVPALSEGSFSALTKAKAFLEFSFKDTLHNSALPLLGRFLTDNLHAFSFHQKLLLAGEAELMSSRRALQTTLEMAKIPFILLFLWKRK